jgi:hypothetical protein
MKLKAIYDNESDIPEKYLELYTERDGKWYFDGVTGVKTQADIDRLQTAVEKERDEHKKTKAKFAFIDDPEQARERLENYDELAARANDIDDDKIEQIVEARVNKRIGKIERERDTAVRERDEAVSQRDEYAGKEKTRTISDAVRKAAKKSGLTESAVEDAILYGERVLEIDESGDVVTRDNVGVTPGIDPETLLSDLQSSRPHWWPESQGANLGGNRGGSNKGANPWTHEHWNVTEQNTIMKKDRTVAENMSRAAGTKIGGMRPDPKK